MPPYAFSTLNDMPPQVFSVKTIYSMSFMMVIFSVAYYSAHYGLSKRATWRDRYTWIWLTFDAMTHFSWEAIFLWNSILGRTAFGNSGLLVDMVKEYALADYRWGLADPTIVSLEILTVLCAGPMACYILKQLSADDPARHYWIIILCTAEIYGTWMTFCPEWLTGNQNLVTSNPLYFWFYLTFMNGIWIVVPLVLLWDSYRYVSNSLRFAQKERPTGWSR
ncbi:hypothetical protein NM688_g769 [Phlebia brevispora]|uniref:Uncharacterized protein n=1 Tax=Phlebia brevispora TaxID=194682 RepID=A0ACC1TDJ3_9APHY|nr:hypothetical protein NM688_g769 [Phlebia brevispora]